MSSDFWKSESGKRTLYAILYVVLLAIILIWWSIDNESTSILVLICAFFGWRALNQIQPAMFLWMSWLGWIIYFVLKFMLAAIVGIFVTPKVIGDSIYANYIDR